MLGTGISLVRRPIGSLFLSLGALELVIRPFIFIVCNRYWLLDCGFEYRLILNMFYVWFRVSSDTQYVLCLVSSIV